MQAFQKGQIDLALLSSTQSLPSGMNHVGLTRGDDATDAPHHYHNTATLAMHRSFSMDSALNENNDVHINGYENIIYEIESESEAQDFLRGESDSGSAARARVAPKRKTQTTTKRGRGRPAGARSRKNIREGSMEVDIESEI